MSLSAAFGLLLLLPWVEAEEVFLRPSEAHALLPRVRRANWGYLEELKQGNLERECMEELCDYEEAREVFEDDTNTRNHLRCFHLSGSSPCDTKPCLNNGTCVYVNKTYECQCLEGFEGTRCQDAFEDTLRCLYLNGGCEHFCESTGWQHWCECAEGYVLGEDGKKCVPQVQYPCGRIAVSQLKNDETDQPQLRAVGGNHCSRGHCPWQVLLEHKGKSLCGGALIHTEWVVTAAHCLDKTDSKDLQVVAGEYDLWNGEEGSEQRIPVSRAIAHEGYNDTSGDSDIALVRLRRPIAPSPHAVPVCLPRRSLSETELLAVHVSTVSGWGSHTAGGNSWPNAPPSRLASPVLRRLVVPTLSSAECTLNSGVNITSNMFCAGYFQGGSQPSCRGNDGSPHVTQYRDTAFLTGVVGWGKGCAQPGYYMIFTKVSNFLDWLKEKMKLDAAVLHQHEVPLFPTKQNIAQTGE
ncbi:coagulation factor VII-like [Arapaima gigas]